VAPQEPQYSNYLSTRNLLITTEDFARILPWNPLTGASTGQLIASLTDLPIRLSISTSVSMVNRY
jgi:hypothetical protein